MFSVTVVLNYGHNLKNNNKSHKIFNELTFIINMCFENNSIYDLFVKTVIVSKF